MTHDILSPDWYLEWRGEEQRLKAMEGWGREKRRRAARLVEEQQEQEQEQERGAVKGLAQ